MTDSKTVEEELSSMMKRKLSEKMSGLDASMDKITGLSKMMGLNYHKAKGAVNLWWEKFQVASPNRYLTFIYVANDIMQNTRRMGTNFIDAFSTVLSRALCITVARNPKLRGKIDRLLQVWGERKVVNATSLASFRADLSQDLSHIGPALTKTTKTSSASPARPLLPPPSPGTPPGTPPPECVARSRLLLQSLHPNRGINMDAVLGEDVSDDDGSGDDDMEEEDGEKSSSISRKRKRDNVGGNSSSNSGIGRSSNTTTTTSSSHLKRRNSANQRRKIKESGGSGSGSDGSDIGSGDDEDDDGGLVDALVYNEAVEGMIHKLKEQYSQVEPDLLQLQQTLPASLVKGSEMESSLRRRILANAGVLKQLKHELKQKEERNNSMIMMIGHEIDQQLENIQNCETDIKTIEESLELLKQLKNKYPNQRVFKLKRKKENLNKITKKVGKQRVLRDDLKHVNDDDDADAKKNLPKTAQKRKRKKKKNVPMVWNRALRAYVPVNVDGSEMMWREH
jgi:hypothetical protein